jgi:hypothetical protein
MKSPAPLVFLHIPKTAGVSVRSVISANFHADRIAHVMYEQCESRNHIEAVLKANDFVHGHFRYELIHDMAHPRRLVTFLRNPVERSLSQYYFLRKHDPQKVRGLMERRCVEIARSHSVEDFFHLDCADVELIIDAQVKSLLTAAQLSSPSASWVECALSNLRGFDFFGLTERMSESVESMCCDFGWPIAESAPLVNQTERPAADRGLRRAVDVISERSAKDLLFYQKAVAIFSEKLKSRLGVEGSQRKLMARKSEVERYSTGLSSPIKMSEPLRCWGFHDREGLDGDSPWRFASGLSCGIELKVRKLKAIVVINVPFLHPKIDLNQLVIESTRQTLYFSILKASNCDRIAIFVPAECISDDGILTINVRCEERAGCTVEIADSRDISFSVGNIEIIHEDTQGAEGGERPSFATLISMTLPDASVGKLMLENQILAQKERAEIAEEYCRSLVLEVERIRDHYRLDRTAWEAERERALVQIAAWSERAIVAENYNKALLAKSTCM